MRIFYYFKKLIDICLKGLRMQILLNRLKDSIGIFYFPKLLKRYKDVQKLQSTIGKRVGIKKGVIGILIWFTK